MTAITLYSEIFQKNIFDPERTRLMLTAYVDVCGALQVSDPADPLSKTIARAVIGLAAKGERDPAALYERTLREVNPGH